jgi:hypothetical protein
MEFWPTEHLCVIPPSFVVMIAITIVLKYTIGKYPLAVRLIPIKIIGVILIILELMKQIYSLITGYDLFDLPFQFCSFFLVVIPITGFYNGKYTDEFNSITCTCCLCLLLFTSVCPTLIYNVYSIREYFKDFRAFHTVTFHEFAIFSFFIIVGLRIHVPTNKLQLKPIIYFIISFVIFAAAMSNILKENYANFYYCTVGAIDDYKNELQAVEGMYVPIQILYVFCDGIVHLIYVLGNYFLYLQIQKLYIYIFERNKNIEIDKVTPISETLAQTDE